MHNPNSINKTQPDEELKTLWQNNAWSPGLGLAGRVLGKIQMLQRRAARLRLVASSIGLALASITTLLAARLAWSDIVSSGAASFAGLIVSDFNAIATQWQNFGYSILEVLPVGSLLLLLIGLLVVVILAKITVSAARRFFHHFSFLS